MQPAVAAPFYIYIIPQIPAPVNLDAGIVLYIESFVGFGDYIVVEILFHNIS